MPKGTGIVGERRMVQRRRDIVPPHRPIAIPPRRAAKPTTAAIFPSASAEMAVRCAKALPSDVLKVVIMTRSFAADQLSAIPNVKIVGMTSEPFVYSRALNAGARIAAAFANTFVFMNDDVFFRSAEDFHTLAEAAWQHPGAGIVAPLATYSGFSAQRANKPRGEGLREVSFVPGFAMAMRKEVYLEIGGWDERYRGYGVDDDDICYAVRKKRYKVFLLESVVVDHIGHATFPRDRSFVQRELAKWSTVFEEKWGIDRLAAREAKLRADVSVLMPCYNAEQYVGLALGSIAQAEYDGDLEIVCVDDGSTDKTWHLLEIAKQGFGDQMLTVGKWHTGVSQTRNWCVMRSTGDILIWLDADDIMPPKRIVESIEALQDADMVYGQLENFTDDVRKRTPVKVEPPSTKRLGDGNDFRIGTAAARRDVFEEHGCWFDEDLPALEDWDWMLTCIEKGLRVKASDKCWLYRRVVPGSLYKRSPVSELRKRIHQKHQALFAYIVGFQRLPERDITQ